MPVTSVLTTSVALLRVLSGIMMDTCQRRREVDRVLAAQGRQGRQDKQQLAITTHADAMRALLVNHRRLESYILETDEEFCASLPQNILRYVCNSVAAAEEGFSCNQGL